MSVRLLGPVLAAALMLSGCGSMTSHSAGGAPGNPDPVTPTSSSPQSPGSRPSLPGLDELRAAEHPRRRQFPAVDGRTLEQVARDVRVTAQLTAATGVYTPGTSRYAFGLSTSSNEFIYAPSAVYIARSPNAPASGPFLAPADPLGIAPRYRSRQNDPDAVRAIYDSELPLSHSGVYAVLVLTRTPHSLIASSSEVAVAPSSPIPAVGQRPPAILTDTLGSVHGDLSLLSTRMPPDDMHAKSFDQVLGKRPVALLFSTPELCVSRVCGPVTDIMVELEHEFGRRIVFIHEEVYVDNQPSRGLRPQLKAFHLQTEPWLYTVNARGVISARLDGAFGVNEARTALKAALR